MKNFILLVYVLVIPLFADYFSDGMMAVKNEDYQKALVLFQKGCDSNELASCGGLGLIYVKGKGIEKDYKKALELYKKGCEPVP